MRNYMKKKVRREADVESSMNNTTTSERPIIYRNKSKLLRSLVICVTVLSVIGLKFSHSGTDLITLSEEAPVMMSNSTIAATVGKKSSISVPTGTVKANPFLPYRDLSATSAVNDVPEFDLVEPPTSLNENSEVARVMDTIVSGILFDKYSPSAILNIEGNDYLVKKGDTVNNYEIVSILQDSVTVRLGSNTYKAGIGEILTEGTLNYNEVSNLNNKFGGVK